MGIYCRSTMAIKTPASVLLLFLAQGQFVTSVSAECCALKTVGDYSYTLTTWEGAIPDECKDSCAYTRDGYAESLYCFAPGYLDVVCLCNPCSECNGEETRCENTPTCFYDTVNEVCSPKVDETRQDDCCIQGPSRYIVESKGPADGVGWPEKHDSVEACAQRCKDLKDCQAFHYYNVSEPSDRTCYLQKGGIIGPQLDDGVMRLAGVCPKTGDCPDGWLMYQGQCYGHPKDNKLSWADAESYCQSWSDGAHLASIHSAEEQKFVQDNFPQNIWLGGSDASQENTWGWSDGTLWDYIDWSARNPDNAGTGQDCLMGNFFHPSSTTWNDLKWDDNFCTSKVLFLCKQ